jgi:hypothetical protein
MRLFKNNSSHRHASWLRDDAGQAYASRGRFRLTIKRSNELWFYRVSDLNGDLAPIDSKSFPNEEATLRAAQMELDESAVEMELRPDY